MNIQVRPEEMNFSPLTSEERKDSLSVQVAFVKFHISRSRKLNFDKISFEASQNRFRNNLEMNIKYQYNIINNRFRNASSVGLGGGGDRKSMTCVRFSTVIDIGSASFK